MRVLFTAIPSNDLGLLARTLPVAQILSAHGHQVAFSSPAEAPRKLIAQAGFENLTPPTPLNFIQITGQTKPGNLLKRLFSPEIRKEFGGVFGFIRKLLSSLPWRMPPVTSELWNIDHFSAFLGMLNPGLVQSNCDAYLTLIDAFLPDVVVDAWNSFACIAARVKQVPLVTIIQADIHPQSDGFIWWKSPPSNLPNPTKVINRILGSYGLASVESVGCLHVGDLTCVVGIPEADPLPEGAKVQYLGPLLWQGEGIQFSNELKNLSTEKPVIWIYSGNPRYFPGIRSWADTDIVLQACIKALKSQPLQVVLTTGFHSLPGEYQPLPANFHFYPFLPGLAMAAHSDLLIHHGRYGSCQTGLYTGTPAVIIPTYSERESNAHRVAALGAREFVLPPPKGLGKRTLDIGELRSKIWQVLTDSKYKKNAQKIQ